ncbi:hypothetical protein H4R20_002860 [Coemansia guatemalensis]|uniref:EF-hand n=1 Tax=Coemansia guatemalensis TaxID=2761395 RepID=A0A9W8LT69_9FUNG|nr:hypothetical protein H4R20_002860 [Coemansia guatemalensis]
MLEAIHSAAQRRLSMIALGLLAGLAGLWMYSATIDSRESSGRSRRRHRRRRPAGDISARTDNEENAPTLERTRTIRRHRRLVSTRTIARELQDGTAEPNEIEEAEAALLERSAMAAESSNALEDEIIDAIQLAPDSGGGVASDDDAGEDPVEAEMRLLHLLCTIAEDQSRRNNNIHHSTSCNNCFEGPIRGTRYMCAQCANYDLCEACEAQDAHRHHLMLKISIPLPPLMHGRIPLIHKLCPGNLIPKELARETRTELEQSTSLDRMEIISLYNEFSLLATTTEDGTEVITRDAFYTCMGKFGGSRSVLANRMFAYYDADNDGMINFPEMARGFSVHTKGMLEDKIPGVFRVYDVDGDGKVSRDDVRTMLEAFADATRELAKSAVPAQEEEIEGESMGDPTRRMPGQTISSLFTAPMPAESPSALDKEVSALRAEVLALRESSAARRVSMLPVRVAEPSEMGRATSDADRASSDADSSAASVAATTSATIGTIASSRMPRRMSANPPPDNTSAQLPAAAAAESALEPDFEDQIDSAVPRESEGNAATSGNFVAAAAAFTDTLHDEAGRSPISLSASQLAEDTASVAAGQGTRHPPLLPSTMWHDMDEENDWSVMEALSQDAIRLMIDEIFTEAAPKDPICMTYGEFAAYLSLNPSLANYLNTLGSIF